MMQAGDRSERAFWVVAANESQAKFYQRETKRAPLQEFLCVENEAARMKKGELLEDRGGRSFDSFGAGRHTMSVEKTDPKKQAATVFAKQIAERIYKATHSGSCRDYVLIAAPRFLGVLRPEVSRRCKMAPSRTIDKDVVAHDAAFLKKLLDQD
ncbi:MAG: host attachment protein [Woeseiaceae bacterium]